VFWGSTRVRSEIREARSPVPVFRPLSRHNVCSQSGERRDMQVISVTREVVVQGPGCEQERQESLSQQIPGAGWLNYARDPLLFNYRA
jgi:hypothetical protein